MNKINLKSKRDCKRNVMLYILHSSVALSQNISMETICPTFQASGGNYTSINDANLVDIINSKCVHLPCYCNTEKTQDTENPKTCI